MTETTALLIVALAIGYCLGSIPFGLLLTRLAGLGDIRNIGSGNIGATNVLRTGRKELAAVTLLLDALKGTASVLIGSLIGGPEVAMAGGLGAFLGHIFPVWLGFKGGKGVATYIGVLLGLHWPAALAFCIVWLTVAILTRYSSLSALVASVATPLLLWMTGKGWLAALAGVLTVLLAIKHSSNIQRLIAGTESKIGAQA
jgi:glycerol-3-phosphate acyltransferase PlsY|nr:MAG: glycerol-3-phosphate acyltransferase [Pseudomonadota bacterium]